MNKKLDTIREEINAKVSERAELRNKYAKKLEYAKTALRNAKEKKIAMISAEDKKGVRAANDEEADARAEVEIYQTKLDALPEKALLDYTESEQFLNRVFVTFRDAESDILKKAWTHIEALTKLEEEYTALANESEELYKQIAFNLCDDDHYYLMNNGKRVARKSMSVAGERMFAQFVNSMKERYGYQEIQRLVNSQQKKTQASKENKSNEK